MADNQDYVIKTTEGDYVVPFKLKVAIDNILLLEISNDKKVKMLKYLLSINFDLKITNNAIIIQMLNDFIGEQITNEVLKASLKRSQKKYYDNHKEEFKEKYRERAEILKKYHEMKK